MISDRQAHSCRQAGLGCPEILSQLVDGFAVLHRCLAKSFDLPPQELKLLPVHFLSCFGVLRLLGVAYGLLADHHPKRVGVLHFLDLCVDLIYTNLLL